MAALWIFAVLAVLLLLLCLIRVGVLVRFGNELIVTVRLGVFRFQVFPEKKRAKEKQKPKRKPPQSAKGKKQAFPKPTFSDVREAAGVLWPSIKKALGRSRRGIRIDPMELSVVLGGQEEPADAAQQYGTLQGTVWTVVPALEQLLVLPHPRIHIDIDFSAETVRASGQVGLSARIGTLVRIGLTLAIPALRDGVTLIPISRVSFGFGSGGGDYGKQGKDNFGGGGGAGVKIDPVAFLVIKDGTTRVMPVAVPPVSTVDRIVDMAPDIVDKIGKFFDKKEDGEIV